ncbi:MAG TPA: hypothetical protein DEB70_09075 [Planctomycetaceae bacterium]|nr:hypothetical protein [Planctomycetaceae bacterium]
METPLLKRRGVRPLKTLNQLNKTRQLLYIPAHSLASGSSDYAGKTGKKATARHQDAIQGALMYREPAPLKTITYV